MSYYFFNRQELLQKAKDKYHNCGGKRKSAKYYIEPFYEEKYIKTKAKVFNSVVSPLFSDDIIPKQNLLDLILS